MECRQRESVRRRRCASCRRHSDLCSRRTDQTTVIPLSAQRHVSHSLTVTGRNLDIKFNPLVHSVDYLLLILCITSSMSTGTIGTSINWIFRNFDPGRRRRPLSWEINEKLDKRKRWIVSLYSRAGNDKNNIQCALLAQRFINHRLHDGVMTLSQMQLLTWCTCVTAMEVAWPGLTMMPSSSGNGIWFCGRMTTTTPAVSPACLTYSCCWISNVIDKPIRNIQRHRRHTSRLSAPLLCSMFANKGYWRSPDVVR